MNIAKTQPLLQKHSQYCKKTANIAKTQQILQKHSRYCKNTADFAKTQPIMQKHSQYCKNTENTANINLVTNRGIPNIHGGKLEISKDDEYYVI